jgi:hypothetical protein
MLNPQAFNFLFCTTDQKAVSPHLPHWKQGGDVAIKKTLEFLSFKLLAHNRTSMVRNDSQTPRNAFRYIPKHKIPFELPYLLRISHQTIRNEKSTNTKSQITL